MPFGRTVVNGLLRAGLDVGDRRVVYQICANFSVVLFLCSYNSSMLRIVITEPANDVDHEARPPSPWGLNDRACVRLDKPRKETLLEENHLLCIGELTGSDPVQIHTGGYGIAVCVPAIPRDIDKCSTVGGSIEPPHQLPSHVEHAE
jgi:hypothetical protein